MGQQIKCHQIIRSFLIFLRGQLVDLVSDQRLLSNLEHCLSLTQLTRCQPVYT